MMHVTWPYYSLLQYQAKISGKNLQLGQSVRPQMHSFKNPTVSEFHKIVFACTVQIFIFNIYTAVKIMHALKTQHGATFLKWRTIDKERIPVHHFKMLHKIYATNHHLLLNINTQCACTKRVQCKCLAILYEIVFW